MKIQAPTELDMSGFQEQISKEEVRAEWQAYKNLPGMNFGLKVLWFFGIFFAILMLPLLATEGGRIAVIILVGLCFGGYILFQNTLKQKVRLRKFASANNFTFIDSSVPFTDQGAIFGIGSARSFSEGFDTSDGKMRFANYQYTVGSGKNRRVVRWGVMRAQLSRALPNIVLDATANNIFGRMTNLPSSFAGGQKFELEGNFNKYFSVFAPSGYERDALYFLTPELMEALVTYGSAYDFEVIDNYLYIYRKGGFKFNEQLLPEIVQTVRYFAWQFEDNVNKYNDDRVANARVANVVTAHGSRLKRKFGWFGFVFLLLYIALQFLPLFNN